MKKIIQYLFYILLFFTPLIVVPVTSELFEFNKMVFVYTMTILIVSAWMTRATLVSKFVFRRTILDLPIILFLSVQLISTIFSIDVLTSIFGYPSRLNGGLLSLFAYALLYWAWVSNMNVQSTKRAVLFMLVSASLISIYAVLQKFGIDARFWSQDVRSRVFSTLGQPNWLAAYLAALSPLAWKNKKTVVSVLLLLALILTRSRSGLLAYTVCGLVYFLPIVKKHVAHFSLGFAVLIFTILILPKTVPVEGVTSSGEIRKIVWKGAVGIWRANPIFGTGPETFAYSYYKYRPVEHNLVSEWNFLYNKAHNEYLNYAANTGTLGLLSYLILLLYSIKALKKRPALIAGYVSILVTNFFGFSVVITNLYLFLFPAMAICSNKKS